MKRFATLALLIAAMAGNLFATGFDFRTTGVTTTQIVVLRPTNGPPTPPVSDLGFGKIFMAGTGLGGGFTVGKLYISENGGPFTALSSFVSTGAVTSVFSRQGAVTANDADYTASQIVVSPTVFGQNRVQSVLNLAAPLASPALTGVPTAPTASPGTNTTQLATTAFVQAASGAVTSVFGRTGAVVKNAGDYAVADVTGAAPLASPAFTGTPNGPSYKSTGTAGVGFFEIVSQSSAPATPASGLRLFANATNKLAWVGSDGFVRTFTDSATASRTYTLPDATGTFTLTDVAQTISATKTFSVAQLFAAGTAAAPGAAVGTATNGLWAPAANQIGISTNGVNAVTVDASQNVGIGHTAANGKLDMKGSLWLENGTTTHAIAIGPGTTGGVNRISSNFISDAYLPLVLSANVGSFANQLYLDTAGRVAIGNAAPSYQLDIGAGGTGAQSPDLAMNSGSGATSRSLLRFNQNGTLRGYIGVSTSAGLTINGDNANELGIANNGPINFSINNGTSRAMTLNSTGLGIGQPATQRLTVGAGGTGTNAEQIAIDAGSGAGGHSLVAFYRSAVTKGLIGVTGTAGTFISGEAANDLDIRNSQAINLSADSGTTKNASISNTGTWTYAVPGATATTHAYTGSTTAYHSIQFLNTGGNLILGTENSAGGGLLTGSTAYAAVFKTANGTPIQLGTNNALAATVGTDGSLKLNQSTGTITERNRSTPIGEWTDVAYSGANFTANGSMTWTVQSGDVTTFSYTITGKTLTADFYLVNTTVGGTLNTTLQIAIPAGFTAAKSQRTPTVTYQDNAGTETVGTCEVTNGATVLSIRKLGSGNWTAATDTTNVLGRCTIAVQ